MKNFLVAILCAVMIIALFPFQDLLSASGFAVNSYAAVSGPTITSKSQQVNAGETISVPIKITNNNGIMGFLIILEYDSTVLTPVDVTGGKLFSSGSFQDSIGYSKDGMVKILWTATENVTSNGTLFTIEFDVCENAVGNTDIEILYSQEDTFNEAFEDVIFNCVPFVLTINNTNPLIAIGNATVSGGESVDVPIDIVRSNGLGAVKFTITYDAEKLTPTKVKNGLATVSSNNIGTTTGSITIVINKVSASVGDGTLFSIIFTANDNCSGTTSVGISSSDGTRCQNGTLTILENENSATLIDINSLQLFLVTLIRFSTMFLQWFQVAL